MGLEVLRGQGSADRPSRRARTSWPASRRASSWWRTGTATARPDVAVVNGESNDVSILLSTACTRPTARGDRCSPAACVTGSGPYPGLEAVVEARDDGGNLACPVGDVTAAIVPGTGTTGATLTGAGSPPAPRSVPLISGVASFTVTSSNSLTIDQPGRRYRLAVLAAVTAERSAGGQPQLHARRAACDPRPRVLLPGRPGDVRRGPAEGSYDEYRLDARRGARRPSPSRPSIVLRSRRRSRRGRTPWPSRRGSTAAARPDLADHLVPRVAADHPLARGPTTVCVDCLGGTVTRDRRGRRRGRLPAVGLPDRERSRSSDADPGRDRRDLRGEGHRLPGARDLLPRGHDGIHLPETTPRASRSSCRSSSRPWSTTSEVQSLAVTSRGAGASGENLLQWVNSTGTPDEIRIRWNKSPSGTSACAPPVDPRRRSGQRGVGHRWPSSPAKSQLPARSARGEHGLLLRGLRPRDGRLLVPGADRQGPALRRLRPGEVGLLHRGHRRGPAGRGQVRHPGRCRTTARSTPSTRGSGGGVWPARLDAAGPRAASSTPALPSSRSSRPRHGGRRVRPLRGRRRRWTQAVERADRPAVWGPVEPTRPRARHDHGGAGGDPAAVRRARGTSSSWGRGNKMSSDAERLLRR